MDDENVLTLTKYISVWGWMIVSLMFLIGTIILFAIPRTNLTIVFGTAFFLVFGVSQIITTRRRKELENQQNGHS